MTWDCADCGPHDIQNAKVVAACHHCGKPLCDAHRYTLRDHAFSTAPGSLASLAHHCEECRRDHHSTIVGTRRADAR